ncbi:PucR family transcriptional regulator [Actinomadura nitritigenes]|uniref:PucR family transcriptional regulator n=1 Tax=Actinomadura nitritigenes TaxID=134602 RepID=UPI003D8CB23C
MRTDARLRDVLAALGPLADLAAAPGGLDVPVRDIVITEPADAAHPRPAALVLAIGARGDAAEELVRAAGRDGASAIAVKAASSERLRDAAAGAGLALLAVPADARWEQVETVVEAVLGHALALPGPDGGDPHGDLFSLAETIAGLTRGIVSIEDAANHVVAYSRSDDEADELRRLTILTRDCPEQYLSVLREWGVYQRLRGGDEVIEIDEHAELGIRRRLVAGVSAGRRLLGSIWVQEGSAPLVEQSAEVLRGAARLAALLDGRVPAGTAAGHVGIPPDTPVTVVAVDPRATDAGERSDRALRTAHIVEIVSVYAAAYRRQALVTELTGRVYLLLPDDGGGPSAVRWTQGLVTALRQNLDTPVQAAVAGPAPHLRHVPAVRRNADRALHVLARLPSRTVASFDDLRASVVLDEVMALLAGNPHLHDPALDVLIEHDRAHDTRLAESLRLYLDAFGDVARAAALLHVHPNTLRHRIRRAVALTGLDLADPDQRLVAMLQLRTAASGAHDAAPT